MAAQIDPKVYDNGRAFYIASCRECLIVLNSGHHYLSRDDAQAECDRHNASAHGTAYEDLKDAVDLIAQTTGLHLTVGYIGNLESWGDDRNWTVFMPAMRHKAYFGRPSFPGNAVTVGFYPTDLLWALLYKVTHEDLIGRTIRSLDPTTIRFIDVLDVMRTEVVHSADAARAAFDRVRSGS